MRLPPRARSRAPSCSPWLVMPGERVRILLRFADFPGLFLYHCHMLEHEDTGLMRNYRAVA